MPDLLDTYVSKCIHLNPTEFEMLRSVMRPQHFPAKSYLLREGEICRFEAFVTNGCLRKYCIDEGGHEVNLQFAPEEWWISDLTSFTEETPSKLFIQAMEDSEVLMINHADKEDMFRKIPALERMFRLMLQRSHATMQERFVSILTQPAEERYLDFLNKYPGIMNRVAQHHIASYLGMTPEFLSKVRKRVATRKQA